MCRLVKYIAAAAAATIGDKELEWIASMTFAKHFIFDTKKDVDRFEKSILLNKELLLIIHVS